MMTARARVKGRHEVETLWAPWRAGYVMDEKPQGCIFCAKAAEHRDEANLILYRGAHCFIMLNAYPYNNGHLMVVPYSHRGDLAELAPPVAAEMITLSQHSVTILRARMRPTGFNIGLNLGSAAGAGIVDHVHLHVVPRWVGDTNFMTIVGDTRVLPQALAESYAMLVAGFAGLPPSPQAHNGPETTSSGQGVEK
jgi:ATP adenylyltransferase